MTRSGQAESPKLARSLLPNPAADRFEDRQKAMEKKRKSNDSINAYSVQCENCLKWRLIPTKEEYETIRHNFIDDPWVCSKKPNASCDDPAGDIEYDNTRIWVIDKPNIPKPPPDTERILIMRKDLSKMDTYYIMPKGGKKARCSGMWRSF
uniref:CW-type domain-containing protein n=1 Tax=Ananas comosus var. bracteatus TaxID=296719 RepID=A0A6V7PF51_ANACO|nr:unnamed protein product [Ananas comosus var. bracteatus]